MQVDPCTTPEYRDLIHDWRQTGARAVGDELAEREQTYDAYTWYLIGSTLGDETADDGLEALETAELVTDDDRLLANLQVAIWFARGIHIDANAEHALALLETGVLPFLEFAAIGESDEEPLDEEADDAVTAESLIQRVLTQAGWPQSLDLTLPLGPSVPDRPLWLHTRHAI
jgi:hypothetical protein